MTTYTYNLRNSVVTLHVNGSSVILTLNDQVYHTMYDCNVEHIDKVYYDLMIWILFYGLGENQLEFPGIETPVCKDRILTTDWDKILCSYSGGADSTALMIMFQDQNITPVYLKRLYNDVYTQNQLNAVSAFGSVIVDTDFELIRTQYGKTHGFNIGIGYCCLLFPLIPILKAGYIVFGAIMEGIALSYGDTFKYTQYITARMTHIFNTLKQYGIKLSLPLAGLSEVHTSRIVEDSPYKDIACSCHVQMQGNKCLECYKCFRKEGILGRQIKVTPRLLKKLTTAPLSAATATIYGIQHAHYQDAFFIRYKYIPTDWINRYDPLLTSLFNPEEINDLMLEIFRKYNIVQFTKHDLVSIQKFCDDINNADLYKE